MLLRPQGIVPNVRVVEDIAEEDRDQDAWAKKAAAAMSAAAGEET
jgi:hypothetical protein